MKTSAKQQTINELKGTIARGGNEKMIAKLKNRLKAVQNNETIEKR